MQEKKLIMAAVLAFSAFGAQAQVAGTWFGGIGVTRIAPNTDSGNLTAPSAPGTQVDVGPDTKPSIFVGRMITDHFSLEFPIAPPFKAEIRGAGAIGGVGTIGTVRSLPITLFAQYRFLEPAARFRPYVMLGLTYAYFYGERGSAALNGVNPANPPGGNTQLDVDSRFGLTPGLGVTALITERWFVDLQYAKSFLKTKATLSTGQTIKTKLNPDVYRIAVGMRF